MTPLALVLFLAQPFDAFAAEQRPIPPEGTTRVVGTVRDTTGLPLPGATIEIDDSLVAVSDAEGRFETALVSGARYRAVVTLPGFDPHESVLEASHGVRLDVVLAIRRMRDQVTVTAPSPEEAVTRPFLLEPVQVYRTPGAQADIFRALQTLPGVSAPDETAGLFVRGGDVSEVLVSLDDAVIAHPYRHETPTGGFRGTVDPLLISGLSFSTGGFSARYGNALSGVLDLRGPERPETRQTVATVGLAGASASIAAPAGDRFAVRGAFNRTFTGVLFAVNGSPRPFDPPPEGWDGSAGFAWNLGRGGRLKGFSLMRRDRVGVGIEQDAFTGLLQASTAQGFVGARWDGALGGWAASASFGHDDYERGTNVGILDRTITDRVASWRLDLGAPPAGAVEWRVGANGALAETSIAGRVPVRGGDLGGVSGDVRFDAAVDDWYGGNVSGSHDTRGGGVDHDRRARRSVRPGADGHRRSTAQRSHRSGPHACAPPRNRCVPPGSFALVLRPRARRLAPAAHAGAALCCRIRGRSRGRGHLRSRRGVPEDVPRPPLGRRRPRVQR